MAADTERDLKVLIVEDVPQDAHAMEAALVEESIRFRSRYARAIPRAAFLSAPAAAPGLTPTPGTTAPAQKTEQAYLPAATP